MPASELPPLMSLPDAMPRHAAILSAFMIRVSRDTQPPPRDTLPRDAATAAAATSLIFRRRFHDFARPPFSRHVIARRHCCIARTPSAARAPPPARLPHASRRHKAIRRDIARRRQPFSLSHAILIWLPICRFRRPFSPPQRALRRAAILLPAIAAALLSRPPRIDSPEMRMLRRSHG